MLLTIWMIVVVAGSLGCSQACASDASGPLIAGQPNHAHVTGNGFGMGGGNVTLTWINPPNGTQAAPPVQCPIGPWNTNAAISCYAPWITPTNGSGGLELLVADTNGDSATVWFSVVPASSSNT